MIPRLSTTRRALIGASLAVPVASSAARSAVGQAGSNGFGARLEADVQRYWSFGSKRSGGSGDVAVTQWLAGRVLQAGFAVEQRAIAVPSARTERAELRLGDDAFPLLPQLPAIATAAEGIDAPLRAAACGEALDGCIALVELPSRRWSSATARAVREPIEQAIAAGAVAIVLVTHGPTGRAIALNAPADAPLFARPVGILAPDDAKAAIIAARKGIRARVTMQVDQREAVAHNLIARLDRGAEHTLVVSTPKSGWFGCAAERGPGVAIWLALAEWAVRALPGRNLFFTANSGHEYENLGVHEIIAAHAPKPAETALWLHLGAGIAARDWHELLGPLNPLPSADPQRYLLLSEPLVELGRTFFAGQPGLEHPYPARLEGAAGELIEILAAGYPGVAGCFSAHRFHHTEDDTMTCVEPAALLSAANGFRRLVEAAV